MTSRPKKVGARLITISLRGFDRRDARAHAGFVALQFDNGYPGQGEEGGEGVGTLVDGGTDQGQGGDDGARGEAGQGQEGAARAEQEQDLENYRQGQGGEKEQGQAGIRWREKAPSRIRAAVRGRRTPDRA